MGACWVKRMVEENPGKKGFIGLIGPTHGDVSKIMVPAILAEFPPDQQPLYVEQKGEIRFPNGALAYCFSSDQSLRGANLEYVWCDELCSWCEGLPQKAEDAFNTLDFACRIGQAKFLITTTPLPWKFLRKWEEEAESGNPLYKMIRGSMHENSALSDQAKEALIKKFGGTRMGRQELDGELLMDNPGALWTYSTIENCRTDIRPALRRVNIAVDPAGSTGPKSDLTGIIVSGLGIDGHCYVLEDATGSYSPEEWARLCCSLYKKWTADRIVIEKNGVGAMASSVLRSVDRYIPIKEVVARQGKLIRAQPVASLYEQRLVHHTRQFEKLEDEMCSYTADPKQDSPNRLDALVYGITDLLLVAQYVRRFAQDSYNF